MDDAWLRVRRLLDAGEGAGAFLAGTRVGPAAGVDAARLSVALPSHIGPWRVLRELGRGGMGTVYLGTREAGDLTLQAAIKVVAGADRDDILRRFRTERRILASLEHPGIARLLDGGTTPEGLPYFALEYVEGVPLTEFARTRVLDLADRLTLFTRVCEAVEFAHRRLVGTRLNRAHVTRALRRMPRERRLAAVRHLAGGSVAELMAETGWSYQKARNLISRGLGDLKRTVSARLGPPAPRTELTGAATAAQRGLRSVARVPRSMFSSE